MHRQFFAIISQTKQYIDTFCNDRNSTFHFACQKWFSQINYRIVHNFITSRSNGCIILQFNIIL